jgi:DNA-binding Lrp family transcriptional regulator
LEELSTECRIYLYAAKGYAQSDIAKFLKVTPAFVCKVIKKLNELGYLKEIYNKIIIDGIEKLKKTKPILYSPTDMVYPLNTKLTNLTSGMLNNDLENEPRLNLICVQYTIIEPPTEPIPGHSYCNNNTSYVDYKNEFECGKITFRIINNAKLVIWYPEKVIDKRHLREITNKIYSEIQPYANWFQKRFHCRLGLPEIYQDYHIAFQEKDPLIREYIEKYGILKIIDVDGRVIGWWDKSKGYNEFETRDERIAEAKIFAPYKIIWLEDKIRNIENDLEEKIKIIFEEKIGPIIEEKIAAIIQKEFSRFFNQPKKSDNFEDVV